MGKAKADHTPELATLDDDAHWLPIKAAHERGVARTGDNDLAVIDLEKLLAEDSLPCMRRSTVSGERILVAAVAWTELIRLYCGKEVSVIYRKPLYQAKGQYIVNPVRGWVFYVWQPDLDRIWPAKQPTKAQRRETREPAGGAPPKFTTHQQDWLQKKYSSDMIADPLLAKHEAAIPHVKELAKTEFGIEAGRNTLLDQIIRPVLRTAKNRQ